MKLLITCASNQSLTVEIGRGIEPDEEELGERFAIADWKGSNAQAERFMALAQIPVHG